VPLSHLLALFEKGETERLKALVVAVPPLKQLPFQKERKRNKRKRKRKK